MNFRNIIKPYPSPIITGRGIDLDFPMLAGCLALLGLGLVMITSASSEVAAVQSGNTLYMMIRHLVYLVIGLGACIVTMMIPIATWQRLGWLMLIGAFGLLIMVILPGIGREVNGSMRWIGFGAFNVQPSEIAKVFVVIYLAGYLVRRQKEVRESWMGFFKPFIVLLPMAGLLLMEPDFGATVVMMGAAAAMLFLGGVGLFRFTLMVVLAVAAVTVLVQAQPYRMARLITFTDPWSDQFGSGYQLTQALIAFGRGEWLGVGLGNSVQKQFYLPEAHTDFVFSVLAEELGVVGSLCTVALFVFVCVRGMYIGLWAEKAKQYLRRVCGVRLVVPVDRPVPDQYRCERRPAADQGPDLAVPQLRRQFVGDLLRLSRVVAAHRVGESNPPGQRRDGVQRKRLRRGAEPWALTC